MFTFTHQDIQWQRTPTGLWYRRGVPQDGPWTGACRHCPALFQTRAELDEHQKGCAKVKDLRWSWVSVADVPDEVFIVYFNERYEQSRAQV